MRADSVGTKRNTRFPFEVSVHERFDDSWFLASRQFDVYTHPIGQWRGYHAVECCARNQGVALESEFSSQGHQWAN